MGAFNLSKEHYWRLQDLFNNDITDVNDYIEITSEYLNLKHKTKPDDYLHLTWELNGKVYTMYNSFSNAIDYNRFIEDCSMAVYRLNGGENYNTYTLIDEFITE